MAPLKQLRKKLLLQKLKLLKSQLRRKLNNRLTQQRGWAFTLPCEIIKAAFAAFFIASFLWLNSPPPPPPPFRASLFLR
jgi:hypothetical protein